MGGVKEKVTLHLDLAIVDRIDQIAREERRSRNSTAARLLEKALETAGKDEWNPMVPTGTSGLTMTRPTENVEPPHRKDNGPRLDETPQHDVASPAYEGSGKLRKLQRDLETEFVQPPTVQRAQRISNLQAEIRKLEARERGERT